MITFEFVHKEGILVSKFVGDIYLKEIIDYIVATNENNFYPRLLKIMTDATLANFKFEINGLTKIVEENNKFLKKYECVFDAIIVNNPKNTAISMIYSELEENSKYNICVFSTKGAALSWLNSS